MKFKPEIGEEFYYITTALDVEKEVNSGSPFTLRVIESGNCFRNFATAKVKSMEMQDLLKDDYFKGVAKPILLIYVPNDLPDERLEFFKRAISNNSVNLSYHIIIDFRDIKDIEYRVLSHYNNNKIDLVKEMSE